MCDTIISWYSGYKGEEYPHIFLFRGEKKSVQEVVERRIIEDSMTKERKREYVVVTEDNALFRILVGNVIEIKRIII